MPFTSVETVAHERNPGLLVSLEVLITVILRQKRQTHIVPIWEKDGITY